MKQKRMIFIGSLLCLFGVCFTIMNRHYDELARYQYVTKENREILLAHLSTDDINYIVAQQIKPEQFLPFIEAKDFSVRNSMWYAKAKEVQDGDANTIVSFINDFKDKLEYSSLESLLNNYSYANLRTFYEEDNDYVKNASVAANPSSIYTLIKENESLYTYQPKELVDVKEIAHVSLVEGDLDIQVKGEVIAPMQQMCSDLEALNGSTCGNLILTAGYISYEKQIPIYERMMLKYGKERFQEVWDYPGQSEYQLGYTIRFQFAGKEENVIDEYSIAQTQEKEEKELSTEMQESIEKEQEVALWLQENAYKYGFILRYPQGKEKITGKQYQPFTLRYIGKDIAKQLQESGKTLDEFKITVK